MYGREMGGRAREGERERETGGRGKGGRRVRAYRREWGQAVVREPDLAGETTVVFMGLLEVEVILASKMGWDQEAWSEGHKLKRS